MKTLDKKPSTIILLTITILLYTTSVFSQGWQANFVCPDSVFILDDNSKVLATADGGGLTLGNNTVNFGPNSYLSLRKVDMDGKFQWIKQYTGSYNTPLDLIPALDGGYLISAVSLFSNPPSNNYVLKVDSKGDFEWDCEVPNSTTGDIKITQSSDGSIYCAGANPSYLTKISVNGVVEWQNNPYPIHGGFYNILYSEVDSSIWTVGWVVASNHNTGDISKFDLNGNELFRTIDTMPGTHFSYQHLDQLDNGDLIILGEASSPTGQKVLKRMDLSGNELNVTTYTHTTPITNTDIKATKDGGYAISATHQTNTKHGELFKYDSSDQLEWNKAFPGLNGANSFSSLAIAQDNGYLLTGFNEYSRIFNSKVYYHITKLDSSGIVYSSQINGQVVHDVNKNCAVDSSEIGLQHILIGDPNSIGVTFTDSLGRFQLSANAGTYYLRTFQNPLWETCLPYYTVTLAALDTINLDINSKAAIECPLLSVNLTSGRLRRCMDSRFYVEYCNSGTIPANNAYIEVELDTSLTVNSSTIPWSSQVGNTFTFPIGQVAVNQCASFAIDVTVSCYRAVGETLCTEAHIYPDTICIPSDTTWDGSITALDVSCAPDSVTFVIRNTGNGNMSNQLNYIAVEDNIVMKTGIFHLPVGDSMLVKVPSNGKTHRLRAEQSPGYFLQNHLPTIAIEGCGVNTSGGFSTGFINDFPHSDNATFLDLECVEITGAYDPNDKATIPTGSGPSHFIEQNVDLDYKIRFQNVGNDTAFNVVIRDTLSSHLDVTTINAVAASHPYQLEIVSNNILKFTFSDIELVDSTTNEPGSHGFAKFSISQQPNLPIGTMVYNDAAIYFDYNEPIFTNTTFHEIGENFIEIISTAIAPSPEYSNMEVLVYPNPFATQATITLKNAPPGIKTIRIFNTVGQLVHTDQFEASFLLPRKGLSSGMLIYSIHQERQLIASGKLMVR